MSSSPCKQRDQAHDLRPRILNGLKEYRLVYALATHNYGPMKHNTIQEWCGTEKSHITPLVER
jgi:hypothetical protein